MTTYRTLAARIILATACLGAAAGAIIVGLALLPVGLALLPVSHAILLTAPLRYEQVDNASCEAASVHIALHMLGVDVPERRLIEALPMDRRPPRVGPDGAVVAWGDPYRAFIGDITRGGRWPLVGYGVYVPPILALVRHEGMTDSFGGSGLTLAALRRALDAGDPVIVWVPKLSLYSVALRRRTWRAWDGRLIPWNEDEHAQVLVGYDSTGFYLDNPDYTNSSDGQWLWHYTTAQFLAGWAVLGNQAVVAVPGHGHAPHPPA